MWLIRSYLSQHEVKDILKDPLLLLKVLQTEQCQATEEPVSDSKFASLYNSSMGSLECQVDDVTCIKIVPAILAVSCEYYWNSSTIHIFMKVFPSEQCIVEYFDGDE
jgi:hypothetical protein